MESVYILDFDDTIIMNQEVDFFSFQSVLKGEGTRLTRNDLFSMRKQGMDARQILSELVPKEKLETTVAERKRILGSNDIWVHAKLNPGVRDALSEIKRRNGNVIILTKKSSAIVAHILKQEGILQFVDEIITAINKHPVIQTIMKAHNGASFVFVSDSEEEIRQIKDLNIKPFCFYNAYKSPKRGVIRDLRVILE